VEDFLKLVLKELMKNKKGLKKYADIFAHIKASDIMTKNVTTLTPENKMSQAKEMMRIKKISGIPILDKENKLIGIISLEDIIKALEFNKINEPIQNIMTTNVRTVNINDNLTDVVEKFDILKLRRFPVVDNNNKVQGIISRVDILHGILEKFNLIYSHDKKRNSTLNQEISLVTGEKLLVKEAEFHFAIDNADIIAAGTGAALLQQFLKKKEIDNEIIRRIGVATYEAETNVVIHSKSTGNVFCYIKEDRIIIRITDSGIGIEDLEKAMEEGFTTASDYVKEFGFGAGMGIQNMKRFTDKLVIISEKKKGTQVEMVFFTDK